MPGTSLRETCYVLKTIPIKERDLVAVLFGENKGKISAIARNGVQSRRFGGCLDFFTASDFELDTRTFKLSDFGDDTLVQMNSAQSKHTFKTLSKSIYKLSCASSLNELVLRAVPLHRPAPDLFKLFSNTLTALDENEEDLSVPALNAFILKLTQWLGLQPALTRCQVCSKPLHEVAENEVYPQTQSGGWTCLTCTRPEERRLDRPLLSKLIILDAYHSMLHPIRKIKWSATPNEHILLLEFLEQHLAYFVPGLDRAPLNSFKFLKSVLLPE